MAYLNNNNNSYNSKAREQRLKRLAKAKRQYYEAKQERKYGAKKGQYVSGRKLRRDKLENRRKDSRGGIIAGRGPAGLVITMIIDKIQVVIREVFVFIWYKMSIPTFQFAWDLIFSETKGFFAGKEKDGDCYNSSVFRYIVTILAPPVGIFMAKGLYGWPSIMISVLLTFFHAFPGIIYAIIVTHKSRYADRYEQRERDEIERIKKLRLEAGMTARSKYGILSISVAVGLLVLSVYWIAKFAKAISINPMASKN